MTIVRRKHLAAAAALSLALTGWHCTASADPRPRKSAAACSKEMEKNLEALDEAGVSHQAFFHACWFNTKPGEATPIVAPAKAAPATKPAETTAIAKPRTATPVAKPAETTAVAKPDDAGSAAKPEEATPAAKPGETTATAKPDDAGPAAKPEEATPAAKPSETTATAKPDDAGSAAKPEEATLAAKPSEATAKPGDTAPAAKPAEAAPVDSGAKAPVSGTSARRGRVRSAERVRRRPARVLRLVRRPRRERFRYEEREAPGVDREPETFRPVEVEAPPPVRALRPLVTVGPAMMQPDDRLRLMPSSKVCVNLDPLAGGQSRTCVNVPVLTARP